MGKIIGIDLGTTNSVVAVYEFNESVVILNSENEKLTPSVVYIDENGKIKVGKKAKNQAVLNPDRTISSVKRFMGSNRIFEINNRKYTPEEISAMILKKIKNDAEEYLNEKIEDVVITVPAYFNDNQRKATIDAGKLAGLNVKRIINEPTASALSYGLSRKDFDGYIMVYDLGGGTFDVSILDVGDGVFSVIATSGDNQLGGIDFDNRLLNLIVEKFRQENKIDLKEDKFAMQKLIEEVEKTKIMLSEKEEALINIPFITANKKGPIHLRYKIEREDFENLIEDLVNNTLKLVNKALEDANLEKEDIKKILLVGGSTKIPMIRNKLENLFPGKVESKIDPEECVALGAAIQGAIINKDVDNLVLVDVIPLSLGIEVDGGLFVPIIERNTSIPTDNTKTFTTIVDNQKQVEINVYQGERKVCKENIYLGKFTLSGIRRAKAGEPQIKVKFAIDVNGLLKVSAFDVDTKVKHEIIIDSVRRLTQEEIQRLVSLARENEIGDKFFEEIVKTRNQVKQLYKRLKSEIDNKNIEYDLERELNMIFSQVEEEIDKDNIDKLRDLYENLKYYEDELEIRKQEIIQDQLLRGD